MARYKMDGGCAHQKSLRPVGTLAAVKLECLNAHSVGRPPLACVELELYEGAAPKAISADDSLFCVQCDAMHPDESPNWDRSCTSQDIQNAGEQKAIFNMPGVVADWAEATFSAAIDIRSRGMAPAAANAAATATCAPANAPSASASPAAAPPPALTAEGREYRLMLLSIVRAIAVTLDYCSKEPFDTEAPGGCTHNTDCPWMGSAGGCSANHQCSPWPYDSQRID